jgi:coatomer protein complex subunit gamma
MANKKDDEGTYYNNKTTIIQEARVFNESPISPRKCRSLLTRIVYLLYQGETFATREATDLFFGTTKLFSNKDVSFGEPDNAYNICLRAHTISIRGRPHFVKWSI